jgi:S1-C subfamily serine protease
MQGKLMPKIASTLARLEDATDANFRGAKEAKIYQVAAPSVVLILTSKGIGSGVLLSADGQVLTNWHVVGEEELVGVVFKPQVEGAEIKKTDVKIARVTKTDQLADLALIQVPEVPPYAKPLSLGGLASVAVGADVHAIGHPTGESWTYTRGIVSQIRRNYEWTTDEQLKHKADVIQTQTPINPGNSGGPLINDALQVVGINSFTGEGEGLNFAVSGDDVKLFLARKADRRAAPTAKKAASAECKPKTVDTWRHEDPAGDASHLDMDCDGKGDVVVVTPDDSSKPIGILVDADDDGKTDTMLLDEGRDGSIDRSLHDTNADGKADLVSFYRNGEKEPYRIERTGG